MIVKTLSFINIVCLFQLLVIMIINTKTILRKDVLFMINFGSKQINIVLCQQNNLDYLRLSNNLAFFVTNNDYNVDALIE